MLDRDQGGVWLGFWHDGGVLYFKDGQVRASYTAADGLGKGHVAGLRLDRDGALWAATEEGGLSRIKDGRIATLTTRNGLPCDTIHWTIEDDDRSFWLYTACGLVRIARTELDAWIADPKRRIETTVWDAADGVRLRSVSPSLLRSSRREVHRWQTVVRDGRRRPGRRSPSSCFQQTPAAGAHRANHRRRQAVRNLRARDAPARQRPRSADRLHRSQPGRAGEGPFQVQAGGPGPGLAGSRSTTARRSIRIFLLATTASA